MLGGTIRSRAASRCTYPDSSRADARQHGITYMWLTRAGKPRQAISGRRSGSHSDRRGTAEVTIQSYGAGGTVRVTRAAEVPSQPDEIHMEGERLTRRDDSLQSLESGIPRFRMSHHSQPADHTVDVCVHGHNIPAQTEQGHAGRRLDADTVEREEIREDLVIGHPPQETEIELPKTGTDAAKDSPDPASLRPGEPPAPDRGLDRSNVRALDVGPDGESLAEILEGSPRVQVCCVLREDSPNEAGDEIASGPGLGPAVRAIERLPQVPQPSSRRGVPG